MKTCPQCNHKHSVFDFKCEQCGELLPSATFAKQKGRVHAYIGYKLIDKRSRQREVQPAQQ
jgi:uncharacterized membrane protein YvbJ